MMQMERILTDPLISSLLLGSSRLQKKPGEAVQRNCRKKAQKAKKQLSFMRFFAAVPLFWFVSYLVVFTAARAEDMHPG